jgi:hypothetical protein
MKGVAKLDCKMAVTPYRFDVTVLEEVIVEARIDDVCKSVINPLPDDSVDTEASDINAFVRYELLT